MGTGVLANNSKTRAVEAYSVNGGVESTNGKAFVALEYQPASQQIA